MLSNKPGKEAWLEPVIDSNAQGGYRFEVRSGKIAKEEMEIRKNGTRTGGSANFRCLLTGAIIQRDHIVAEGKAGRMGQRMIAIVAEGPCGRIYLAPQTRHGQVAASANPAWSPDTDLPNKALGFRVQEYGITKHRDLFTRRQLVALTTFADLVEEVQNRALKDAEAVRIDDDASSLAEGGSGARAYAECIALYLAFATTKVADRNSSIVGWAPGREHARNTFTRQALSMLWDFAESNCFSDSSGNFAGGYETIANVIDCLNSSRPGSIIMADASSHDPVVGSLISTDPPYYDNVPYADLSDFFYVWLRCMLHPTFPGEFATFLVPKNLELVAEPARHGSSGRAEKFFVEGMTRAISRMVENSDENYPAAIYYAFKQAEAESEGVLSTGWATFLEAVILSSYQVDGTWPVRTELARRVRGQNSNALASSIVLVCRKRPADAPSVTRGEFLRALRAELPAALRTLQESAIAPVDMAQASIGPGMAVFSRYKEVLEADDAPMSVREALRIINAELDAYLAEQEGDYDSWTRFALTWFQQHGFDAANYGEAETLAKARDVAVRGVVEAGILKAKAGKVRLLKRAELPDDYRPFTDNRQTVWEGCQHLIKRLEGQGEDGAARLAKQLGYQADMARDLAYRLYQICERNKWAEEARAYNGLIESWREIVKIRDTLPDETPPAGPAQAELLV